MPRAGAGRAFLSMRVADAVGRGLAGLGVNTVFGVVGSGNFHVTNALVAGGAALDRAMNREQDTPARRRVAGLVALLVLIAAVGIVAFALQSIVLRPPLGLLVLAVLASTLLALGARLMSEGMPMHVLARGDGCHVCRWRAIRPG